MKYMQKSLMKKAYSGQISSRKGISNMEGKAHDLAQR